MLRKNSFILIISFIMISLISVEALNNSAEILTSQTNITEDNSSIINSFYEDYTYINETRVQYASSLSEQFENNTLVNVIITLENSVNIDNFVANFSNDELKDVINRDIPDKSSNRFGAKISEEAFLKLIQDDGVRNIEYNGIGHIFLDDSSPLINADDAWSLGYNGSGVLICIIDTGIDTDQSALSGRINDEYCYCSITDLGSGGCCSNEEETDDSAEDDNGHGTHVAGIVASEDSTYKGIAYDSNLYVVKVTNASGDFLFLDLADAIDLCRNWGANITTMSLGGEEYSGSCSGISGSVETAINSAYEENIFLVAASGNDGNTTGISYPSCQANVVSVGAVYDENLGREPDSPYVYECGCYDNSTEANKITCYTNRASNLDLLAPGSVINSTKMGGGFVTNGGTSMAAPHVAGAAALLLQKNPTLTPDEIRDILQYTGVSVYDGETGLTFKRIDVLAAINLLNSTALCYQESANVSTACGGLSTGRYANDSNWDPSVLHVHYAYDKSWYNYAAPDTNKIASLNVNYTKPSNALSSSFLKVKDVGGIRTIPIPSSCWNYNATTLMIKSVTYRGAPAAGTFGTNWSCYNGSWTFLSNADGDSLLYEEGMYWIMPSSSTWCYQEFANVSSACGGLNTGRYTNSSNWDSSAGNVKKTYEGDWSTWGYPSGTAISYLNINYTKPTGALSTSILKVKDSVASTRNVSILQSCWNYNATTLMLKSEVRRNVPGGVYGVNWSCYNGATWAFLSNGNDDSLLYEEGMWWNINS